MPIVFSLPLLTVFLCIDKCPSWRLVRVVFTTSLFFLVGALLLLVLYGRFFHLYGEGGHVLYGALMCASLMVGQVVGYIRYRRIRETPEPASWLLIKFPFLRDIGMFILTYLMCFFGVWVVLGLAPLASKTALLDKPYGVSLIFSVPVVLAIGYTYWRYKIKGRA